MHDCKQQLTTANTLSLDTIARTTTTSTTTTTTTATTAIIKNNLANLQQTSYGFVGDINNNKKNIRETGEDDADQQQGTLSIVNTSTRSNVAIAEPAFGTAQQQQQRHQHQHHHRHHSDIQNLHLTQWWFLMMQQTIFNIQHNQNHQQQQQPIVPITQNYFANEENFNNQTSQVINYIDEANLMNNNEAFINASKYLDVKQSSGTEEKMDYLSHFYKMFKEQKLLHQKQQRTRIKRTRL